MHKASLAGNAMPRDEWAEALKPALKETYAYVYVYANANANAYGRKTVYQSTIKRLADGMVECLARVRVAA